MGILGSHMNPSKLDDLKTKHERSMTVSEKVVLDRVIISEIALEKQKETFKNLIYFNKLMRVSMGGFNVNQKLLDLITDDKKYNNPTAPLVGCRNHVLLGAHQSALIDS